uniref:Uncharacterized protein n=1 Tax=Pan troglodytes TaxID=9598 RepID=A0A2I3TP24_PANTR
MSRDYQGAGSLKTPNHPWHHHGTSHVLWFFFSIISYRSLLMTSNKNFCNKKGRCWDYRCEPLCLASRKFLL